MCDGATADADYLLDRVENLNRDEVSVNCSRRQAVQVPDDEGDEAALRRLAEYGYLTPSTTPTSATGGCWP